MARITEEQKKQINELYCVLKVKSEVAKRLGVSVASVTKYLIPDYKPEKKEVPNVDCTIPTIEEMDLSIFCGGRDYMQLTPSEKEALTSAEMKGFMI